MMIPAVKVYEKFGIPRSMIRGLADAGIVKREERSLDPTHTLLLYDEDDIEKYVNGESADADAI